MAPIQQLLSFQTDGLLWKQEKQQRGKFLCAFKCQSKLGIPIVIFYPILFVVYENSSWILVMGLLPILVYSILTFVIFLCLHRYFCAELRPAGSWAANHMPFTPETSFPLGPACDYFHLLTSWIFGTSVQFLHLLLNHLVWCISLSKLLGLRSCTHFWDLFIPLVLVTSIPDSQPIIISVFVLI